MRIFFGINARRSVALFARCGLLASLAVTTACPECDVSRCVELCEEINPSGEAELDACKADCADEAAACRDR